MQRIPTVLIVEDDAKTAALVKLYLEGEGFRALVASDGNAGLAAARASHPDLLILDMMLPGIDGLELCRRLRVESDAPVIALTARVGEEDRVAGLGAGADDYVTKPFSPRELVARVRAVLRRSGPHGPRRRRILAFDGFILDAQAREVRVASNAAELTPAEFDLLEALCRSPGIALTRTQLVEQAFGHDYEGAERTVDAHVANLRRKLSAAGTGSRLITTVFGIGYKFTGRKRDG